MIRLIRNWVSLGVAVFLLTACSRTVEWEEEVPLNTGEIIWVKRSIQYSLQGGAGNPLDVAWRPKKEQVLDFSWNGKGYRYEGGACLQVLAIRDGMPVLIGNAWCQSLQWTHNYDPCERYVQLFPRSTKDWDWLIHPEDWVYGLDTNLAIDFSHIERFKSGRITASERDEYKTKDPRGISQTRIVKPDPNNFENVKCRKEEKK